MTTYLTRNPESPRDDTPRIRDVSWEEAERRAAVQGLEIVGELLCEGELSGDFDDVMERVEGLTRAHAESIEV